ncbi:hypothetical protein Tco_0500806 [Tanacetum coccineum]
MVRCRICRSPGVIKTSWTPTNPGRRFYCCSKRGTNYGIIDWFDPPMCDRAVQIIPELLRTMNELQEIIAHYRAQETNVENHVEALLIILLMPQMLKTMLIIKGKQEG